MEQGYIPNTISYVKLFMDTMKIKNNCCDGYQYEIQKIWDGGANNAFPNLFEPGGGGKHSKHNILCETMFMTNMKMKSNFCGGY